MKKIIRTALVSAITVLYTAPSMATVISGATSGISNPDVIQNFDPIGSLLGNVTNEFPGLTFICGSIATPCVGVEGWQYSSQHNQVANPIDTLASSPDAPDAATILFGEILTGASFQFGSNPGITSFSALLGGVVVETFFADTTTVPLAPGSLINAPDRFYGFADLYFDSILINAPANHAFQLDNLAFRCATRPPSALCQQPTVSPDPSVVPAPAALPLFLSGLAVLGFLRGGKRLEDTTHFSFDYIA